MASGIKSYFTLLSLLYFNSPLQCIGLTIEEKLNKLCPQFMRWDLLFGDRQNINPSYTADASSEESAEEEDEILDLAAIEIQTSVVPADETLSGDEISDTRRRLFSGTSKSGVKPTLNPVLAQYTASVALDSTESAGEPRSKKSKGDFTSVYNQAKANEMEMLREHKDKELEISSNAVEISSSRLQFDARMAEQSHAMQERRLDLDEKQIKESCEISSSRLQFDIRMAEQSLAMQERRLKLEEKQIQESSKREILLALIAKDKTLDEMKAYMQMLKE